VSVSGTAGLADHQHLLIWYTLDRSTLPLCTPPRAFSRGMPSGSLGQSRMLEACVVVDHLKDAQRCECRFIGDSPSVVAMKAKKGSRHVLVFICGSSLIGCVLHCELQEFGVCPMCNSFPGTFSSSSQFWLRGIPQAVMFRSTMPV